MAAERHLKLAPLAVAAALVVGACTTPSGDASPTGVPAATGSTRSETGDATPGPPGPLLMWGRGGLDEAIPARVAALSRVASVRTMRSDTLGLVASSDQRGQPVDDLEDGFQIPITVTAIDPGAWRKVLAEAGVTLAPIVSGQALVSAAFASRLATLPGATSFSTVTLRGLAPLGVVGTVPDGIIGSADVIVHEDGAAALGIQRGPTIVIEHVAAAGPDRRQLVAQLEALGTTASPVRVVDTEDPTVRHDAPLVLSLRDVKSIFGEFAYRPRQGTRDIEVGASWARENIVVAEVPLLGRVTCHRGIIDDLRAALQELSDAGQGNQIDPDRYAGCFVPRRIDTTRASLSHHAWGIALDINVDLSVAGGGLPPSDEVIAVFAKHGFRWGGDFIVPDNHHFEWVGGLVQTMAPRG